MTFKYCLHHTFATGIDSFDTKGDKERLVNYGLSIKGIKFAVIFIENKE